MELKFYHTSLFSGNQMEIIWQFSMEEPDNL
jgi:hypothetical protein